MLRGLIIILSLLAPFMVPWPYAVVLGLAAAYVFPAIALVLGVVFEFLYGTGAIPWALILGIIGFALMYGVRHIVKTRIMDA